MSEWRRILNPEGTYVSVGAAQMGDWVGPLIGVLKVLVASLSGSQKMVPMLARQTSEDLVILGELLGTGVMTPVIDRQYELSDVPQAIRYLEEGHARGKVVITV
jgi:NADPH:quinone reductase-like Zn-dependent oxidoreductase